MTDVWRVYHVERTQDVIRVSTVRDLQCQPCDDEDRELEVQYSHPRFDYYRNRQMHFLWWDLPSDPGDLFTLDEEG